VIDFSIASRIRLDVTFVFKDLSCCNIYYFNVREFMSYYNVVAKMLHSAISPFMFPVNSNCYNYYVNDTISIYKLLVMLIYYVILENPPNPSIALAIMIRVLLY
jgi:hypothetical protein